MYSHSELCAVCLFQVVAGESPEIAIIRNAGNPVPCYL